MVACQQKSGEAIWNPTPTSTYTPAPTASASPCSSTPPTGLVADPSVCKKTCSDANPVYNCGLKQGYKCGENNCWKQKKICVPETGECRGCNGDTECNDNLGCTRDICNEEAGTCKNPNNCEYKECCNEGRCSKDMLAVFYWIPTHCKYQGGIAVS
jgi:hypothetical protein